MATVSLDDGVDALAPAGDSPGRRAVLMVRPEHVMLGEAASGQPLCGPESKRSPITAPSLRFAARLSPRLAIRGELHQPRARACPQPATPVTIGWQPEHGVLIAEDA